MTELIRQRTRHDCAICTIAMALGVPYETVMERALEGKSPPFDAEKGCHSEFVIIERFGLEQMNEFRIMHRGILHAEFFRQFSWRRRTILAVPSLNRKGSFHSVYFDGRNVMDPCLPMEGYPDLRTYSEWSQLNPDELIIFA